MIYPSITQASRALNKAWRWPHFSVPELACRCDGRFCSGEYWHDAEFLDALEMLRARMDRPLRVTSGHRCAQWNAAVGGAPRSMHKTIAVDISLSGHDRFLLLAGAEALGFTGIGLANTFIHLDRREAPARWYYKGSYTKWQT